MILKVNHEELGHVTKTMLDDSGELEIEIKNLLTCIDSLRNIWQGVDSDEFYKNAHDYLTRMLVIPNAISTMGNFVKKVDSSYEENDQSFAKGIEAEKVNLSPPEYKLSLFDKYNGFNKLNNHSIYDKANNISNTATTGATLKDIYGENKRKDVGLNE